MPFEEGISKATKNLDKAAEAAPTSKVVHATDTEKKKDDHDGQNDVEDQHDDSDD